MKRFFTIILLSLAFASVAKAQVFDQDLDTLGIATVDSLLVGKDILGIIGPGISVNQSPALRSALRSYVSSNALKSINGYRIRVFNDNSQNARTKSESIERYIANTYPGTRVYRSYDSPNYRVCVGDFRSKDEALGLYNSLKSTYPSALIIKESINYPR